jgi:hypothetical protein
MNVQAPAFLPSGGCPATLEKTSATSGRPPKVKNKPDAAVPQSLSAMNLAMTPEEEAIARDVEVVLQPECSTSNRMSFAGKVGRAVQQGVSSKAFPWGIPRVGVVFLS